jgi:hypothetical protein
MEWCDYRPLGQLGVLWSMPGIGHCVLGEVYWSMPCTGHIVPGEVLERNLGETEFWNM